MPIVEAVMTASAPACGSADSGLAQFIEKAMATAVNGALAKGVSIADSETISNLIQEARERAKLEYYRR